MAHDVFISHSVKDKATADAVCAMLESEGVRCWIAPRDVLPSMEWSEALVEAIEQTRIMVLVFTANANASPQIRREVERAVNCGVAILPLRIEDVLPAKGLDYFIGNLHWLDALTPPFEAHLKNLAGTIKILLARVELGAAPTAQPAVSTVVDEANPPQPAATPAAKPAITPALPQEEKAPSSSGHRAPETAPAPRPFWSARSWSWAGGAVAALLVAAFVGAHFIWGPGPVASPQPIGAPPGAAPPPPEVSPQPAQHSPASLGETMRTLQSELSSIGNVSFTANGQNKIDGSAFQNTYMVQVSNAIADQAHCRVAYDWRAWQNGAEVNDAGYGFNLQELTSVVVEPQSQHMTEATNVVVTSTKPPVTALLVHGLREDFFLFTDATLADRTATTLKEAVKLCGGHLAN